MTPLLLALIVVQAVLLFWSSVSLSNLFLQPNKGAQFLRFLVTFGLPLTITWYGRELDPYRALCGWTDCVAIAVGIGLVRLWAVNRDTEQYVFQRRLAQQAAAEELAAARRSYEEEKIRSATAALEARQARAQPANEPRHQTTPLLRGAARSTRFPSNERKS